MLVVIILRKVVFILSKQQRIDFTLKKMGPARVAIWNMWSFALHVTKSTLKRLEKGKQGFETGFEFIDNTFVNRIINNLNARNTFELVEKENSKYFLSSNYIRRINT